MVSGTSVSKEKVLPVLSIVMVLGLSCVVQFSHRKAISLLAHESVVPAISPIPKPEVVKLLSGGYQQLIADFWWLNFIQYYGDTRARLKDHFQLAYPYLDLITKLDPHFVEPFWFAAFVLGSECKNPGLAAQIIDRGIAANSDQWYLPFIGGVNQYLFAHNDYKAARYYKRAASYPGAPAWLAEQAKILASNSPALIKETLTWNRIYVSSQEPLVKEAARRHLIDLWIRIYKVTPSAIAKRRALIELQRLGAIVREAR